ncbi:MAG TPA: hypothetical protein VND41_04495 [Nitrososphaerales archaeon]|nr:hypothetical protein [Nitrososphaerales archaeon]
MARMIPAAANPTKAQAVKPTTSITARMAGCLKRLSPPLPLRPARSWDLARTSAMA